MSQLKYNECRRQCRYNYTPEERLEKGRALADTYQALDAENSDLERVKKQYKARIETHEAAIQNLAEQVRTGYELRETLCFWEYNNPRSGRKILKRSDTFEVVGEEDMTGQDSQKVMEAIDAEAAGQTPAQPEMKREPILVLPAGELPVSPWPELENILVNKDPIYGSAMFNSAPCEMFTNLLRDLYYAIPGGACSDDDEVREGVRENILLLDSCEDFLAWLEERSRPGGRKVAALLREYGVKTPAEIEADAVTPDANKSDTPSEPPTQPAPKKPRKKKGDDVAGKGRRTSRGGVVACDSDGDDIDDPEANRGGDY